MIHGLWKLLRRGWERFYAIDGTQRAGALAYSAFASLFPMILLFLTAASFLVDRERAGRAAVAFIESYFPMNADTRRLILATIAGMVAARGRAGAAALLILLWSAGQCFSTFVSATNRAWGVAAPGWWRLPLKSLLLLGVVAAAVPASMTASTLARLAARHIPGRGGAVVAVAASLFLPMAVEFSGLAVFYRYAPRRATRFAEVRSPAIIATLLLRAGENLFVIYLDEFTASNAVYGAFGGIMALLLWIYVSGCVFIYGACLCAVRGELNDPGSFAGPPH